MTKKLTAKQEAFCREYLIDKNATQACIRAGYSEKTAAVVGHENLRKPNIKEFIDQLMAEQAERTGISADYVLNSLKSVADRCMQAEQVIEHDGTFAGEFKFEHSGANRSLELLGKHLGLFDKDEKKDTEIHIHIDGKAGLL